MYDILELNKKKVTDLRKIAKELKIKRVESLRKEDLIYSILDQQAVMAAEISTQDNQRNKESGNPRQSNKSRRSRKKDSARENPEKKEETVPEGKENNNKVVATLEDNQQHSDSRENKKTGKSRRAKITLKQDPPEKMQKKEVSETTIPVSEENGGKENARVQVQEPMDNRKTENNNQDRNRNNNRKSYYRSNNGQNNGKSVENEIIPEIERFDFEGRVTTTGVVELTPEGYG